MRYRPHRGSLEQSLKEIVEYDSIEDMKEGLACEWFDKKDIIVAKDSYYDKRIGYSTAAVCVDRFGNEDYIKKYKCPQCIGFVEVKDE